MKINSFVPDTKVFDSFNNSNKKDVKQDDSIGSFADELKNKIDEINGEQVNADNLTESFIKGDNTNVDNVMLATQEASMSLQLAVQIRNKIIDAYQELTKMQM